MERTVDHICSATGRLGIDSHVFALSPHPRQAPFRHGDATVHQRKRHMELASCSISLNTLRHFRTLIADMDVIHYHFPWPFADVMHLLMASREKPSVVTYHSDIVRQRRLERLYRPVRRRFLASVNTVVATSPQYRQSSQVLSELDDDRTQVIPLGLEEQRYPVPSAERIRAWKARVGEGFFFFVGVLRYYKGLHILLEALQHTNHRVIIAGEGPMETALKEQARKLGLGERVIFTGHLHDDEDKMALLRLCRAKVFPSHLRSEAFGVSLIEATMAARPLITTELATGTSYVNQHEETGLVVRPADPQALADAMERLVQEPDTAQRLANGARQRFETHLTADVSLAQYAGLYRSLMHPGYRPPEAPETAPAYQEQVSNQERT
ncbi:glycosyltransferase [Aquisalimonas sp. APHAB1-3]|uniref:glycosyltransferase n=1 Tax=Aquisalimonas sp. APHAB1-3 TaxID=3402080 RepID=UPI003AB080A7